MSETVELYYSGVENSIHVPEHRVAKYEARGWARGPVPDGDAALLKGKELDAALDAAGLSKSGSADEKRARLAAAAQQGDED